MAYYRFNFNSERLSFSEPDLSAFLKQVYRFTIKHPHEYITIDELKYYRRRKPPEYKTKSNICLNESNYDQVLPFSPLKSEYTKSYIDLAPPVRTLPVKRPTCLRLEGLMPSNKSEHQDRYLWFTPEDWKSSRSYPIKKPESLCLSGGFEMEPEYRSSYIMYPMVDRTMKILPREVFNIQSPEKTNKTKAKETPDIEIIQNFNEDKKQREKTSALQKECHLQKRAVTDESQCCVIPSEYQRQFVPQLIEKSHSIPQTSHIKMQGEFHTVPEYQDSFKMYANYAKPMPIKKMDNLRISGSEFQINSNIGSNNIPEYKEKFHEPPKDLTKEKPLKTEDHLKTNGEFSKNVPEYYESFRDPQVKQMPEKGKCREPYLHLKGKIEFNPVYRNTYLNFPRSRPIVTKPASTFRLPTSNNSTMIKKSSHNRTAVSPKKYEDDLTTTSSIIKPETNITVTPEYRRAYYNYQIRERSPKQDLITEINLKDNKKFNNKVVSPEYQKTTTAFNCQRRPSSILESQSSSPGLENINQYQKTPKFGRRAVGSVLRNAENCRANTSVIEGNPKYTISQPKDTYNSENIHDSFVVLNNKSFKRSH